VVKLPTKCGINTIEKSSDKVEGRIAANVRNLSFCSWCLCGDWRMYTLDIVKLENVKLIIVGLTSLVNRFVRLIAKAACLT